MGERILPPLGGFFFSLSFDRRDFLLFIQRVFILKNDSVPMPIPEEVDEINEYLKARRAKQDLGELPRTDLTPSFFKRMQRALFGEKVKAKVPLQSMQPTYASPMAQSAVRKQLDEIMQERSTRSSPVPTSLASPPLRPIGVSERANPRPLPPIPRFPESNVWAKASPPAIPSAERNISRASGDLRLSSSPPPMPAAKASERFWNNPPTKNIPLPPIFSQTNSIRTDSARPPVDPKTLPTRNIVSAGNIPPSPPAPSTPPPYTEIPPIRRDSSSSPLPKSFNPISSVESPALARTEKKTTIVASPPVRGETIPISSAASPREGYAPPWVTRMNPKPKMSSSLTVIPPGPIVSVRTPTDSPSTRTPLPAEVKPIQGDGRGSPPAESFPKLRNAGVLPREAGEEYHPLDPQPDAHSSPVESSPAPPSEEMSRPLPSFPSRMGSGEVRVDELDHSFHSLSRERRPPLPDSPPSRDAALHEEISEEEAIDRLPFEEVEGLSESDLAYLERKEKEHAQTHEEEIDRGNPAEMRTHLEGESHKLGALPPTPNEDPKKEILRRLKEMMEENHSPLHN